MPSKLGKFKKVHPKGPAEPGGCNCPTPTYFGSLVIALFHTGVGGWGGSDYAFPGVSSLGVLGLPWQTPDFDGSVKNNTPGVSDLPTALPPHNNLPPAP